MPKVEFGIECSCGEDLAGNTKDGGYIIVVIPCEKCLDKAFDDGYKKGYLQCNADHHLTVLKGDGKL